MAVDLRRLRPAEALRVLNSTAAGAVVSDRRLRRVRDEAGFRIAADGDARRIDLVRLAAYLRSRLSEAASGSGGEEGGSGGGDVGYERHRAKMARRRLLQSMAGRDIGPIPDRARPRRWSARKKNLRRFCEGYFPGTFSLAWSPDHLRVIARIEAAVLEGELFAMAMPRGSGKTSLCEAACLWALLYGHRKFIVLIGADDGLACDMLESMLSELENNEALAEDFPEVCVPIRALEGIRQRARGQLCEGRPTLLRIEEDSIRLPYMPGSASSSGMVRAVGLTAGIRGQRLKTPEGEAVRPDLVLIDDPQTRASAQSKKQCADREALISGDVLGLAGPGRRIAGLMTLTVIRRDDLADRMLDRSRNPDWQAERTKMLYSLPTNEGLWAKYDKIRREELEAGRGMDAATRFYKDHREAMDAGAVVAWEARKNKDELSAVQSAMNLKFRDPTSFAAEYQNEPLSDAAEDLEDGFPEQDDLCARLNRLPRGVAPVGASRLVMMIDVQQRALYWSVVAVGEDFSGWVLDYGAEPEQGSPYYTLRDMSRTLTDVTPEAGVEGSIYAGLERLADRTLGREWKHESGSSMRVERCLVDANYRSDVIYAWARRSRYAATILPAIGRYVGASSIPFSQYRRKPGDRVGLNWRIPAPTGVRAVRYGLSDVNFWKSFLLARFLAAPGDPGAWTLFGESPATHYMLADHLRSEQRLVVQGRGRICDEWKARRVGEDNHLLDCLVGCAVAASMLGVSLPSHRAEAAARPRVRFSDMARQKRGRS